MNLPMRVLNGSAILYLWIAGCGAFELFSLLGAASTAIGGAGVYKVYDYLTSGCSILEDRALLANKLQSNVFGQHIVFHQVIGSVSSHVSDLNPPHALSLVFAGATGTGKNYVAQMIAESIHKDGLQSKFVHIFSGRFHFPHDSQVHVYHDELRRWIHGNVSACPHSVFIFDEIDKMPAKVLDGIKPYLDYSAVFNRVNFKHAIFIFLTNLGGLHINKKYKQIRETGLVREEMTYKHFENDLRRILFESQEGMFQNSDSIKNHVISQYLPFLPLEKQHVESCIRNELKRKNIEPSKSRVDQIIDYVDFFDGVWSVSGCKRISDHVSLVANKWGHRH